MWQCVTWTTNYRLRTSTQYQRLYLRTSDHLLIFQCKSQSMASFAISCITSIDRKIYSISAIFGSYCTCFHIFLFFDNGKTCLMMRDMVILDLYWIHLRINQFVWFRETSVRDLWFVTNYDSNSRFIQYIFSPIQGMSRPLRGYMPISGLVCVGWPLKSPFCVWFDNNSLWTSMARIKQKHRVGKIVNNRKKTVNDRETKSLTIGNFVSHLFAIDFWTVLKTNGLRRRVCIW